MHKFSAKSMIYLPLMALAIGIFPVLILPPGQVFNHNQDFGAYMEKITAPLPIIESLRLSCTRKVRDREIFYQSEYDLGFGQALSQCFSRASLKHLGRSTGLHGLRHSYAKNRIKKLTSNGISIENARLIVSQELGHFRADIIGCYLR